MKTITYNPETHALVPREPGLDITEPGWEAVDWEDIRSPSQLYLVWKAMLAAAPQPEPVDVDPVGYVDYGDRVEWYKKPAPETDLYTTPQPDRVAELEAETTKLKLDLLTSYGEAEELSGKVAGLEAALKVAKAALEYYVPMIKQGDSPAEEAIAKIEGVLKHA